MSETMLMTAMEAMSAHSKKIEKIKCDIRIQEEAFNAIPRSVETSNGYKYYLTEKERIARGLSATMNSFDAKIADLEAKKKVMMDEFDRKIQKVESDKAAGLEKLENQNGYYDKLMLEMREKVENAQPTSLVYRKLVAQLAQSEQEEVRMKEEYTKLIAANTLIVQKRQRDAMREMEVKERERLRLEKVVRDEAIAALDAKCKKEQDEYIVRYKTVYQPTEIVITPTPSEKKTETGGVAKAKRIPKKVEPESEPLVEKISFPLNPRKRYTIEQLDLLCDETDYDSVSQKDWEMQGRCYAYAMRWKGSTGWEASNYNHINEERDGDVIPEDEFEQMFD